MCVYFIITLNDNKNKLVKYNSLPIVNQVIVLPATQLLIWGKQYASLLLDFLTCKTMSAGTHDI